MKIGAAAALMALLFVQQPEPALVGDGIVSTGDNEFSTALSPDGRTIYWTLSAPNVFVFPFVILQSTRTANGWGAAGVAPFSGTGFSDGDPAMSPDGRRVVFMSRRPVTGTATRTDFDLWEYDFATRATRHIEEVASDSSEIAPSIAANGTLYFCSSRAGGKGTMDIWRARYVNGRYTSPENLPGVVNTAGAEANVAVAPDESFVVFSGVFPGGLGGTDLYISDRQPDGSFGAPRPLRINTPADDYAPAISADGKTFYFTSRRPRPPQGGYADIAAVNRSIRAAGNGNADIYSVPVSAMR